MLESNGQNSYNALNVIFSRRYGKGLTVSANYTYAQALANVGGPGGPCDSCTIMPNNLRYDYGFSDYDVRHRAALLILHRSDQRCVLRSQRKGQEKKTHYGLCDKPRFLMHNFAPLGRRSARQFRQLVLRD